MKKVNIDISKNKRYEFPILISVVKHRNKIIVIAPEKASWIILTNERQLVFFNLLKSYSVGDAIKIFHGEETDCRYVLLQVEARHFFEQTPVYIDKKNHAHLYLTNACNLRCPHCYMFADKKKPNELSTEEIIEFLRNFRKFGGEEIVLSGGEICMRDDLFLILKETHELNLLVKILTNGTLWSPSRIEEVSSYINEVQVSIDGYNEEENAKIRGKGNFKIALEIVDEFVKRNIPTKVAITPIYSPNLKSKIFGYVNFINSLIEAYKGKNFRVIISKELLDGRNVALSSLQQIEYRHIMSIINEKCLGDKIHADFIKARKRGLLTSNCSYGDITLSANGDIYFCNRLPYTKQKLNIRTHSFENIWAISSCIKRYSDVKNLLPCNSCELVYICGGGCRIDKAKDILKVDLNTKSNMMIHCDCDISYKESIYDKLIDLNELIYY